MTELVVLGGTGDAYLVSALARAFEQHHGWRPTLVIASKLAAVVQLFPHVAVRVDDGLVQQAQNSPETQANHDNVLGQGRTYYAHPCFLRSRIRVDKLTTKPDASQADMYRMILQLPPDTPLDRPCPPLVAPTPNTVVVIQNATSWPNVQPTFWPKLITGLRTAGWIVLPNDLSRPLDELIRTCTVAEWVIGPQNGLMSILVTGEFPCRKTLATPDIDGNRAPQYLATDTFPYAYVTKFANYDYDIEEYKISGDNHDELVELISHGVNATRARPHDPRPTKTLLMPLAPGEFLDRLAVLTVKRSRFPRPRRAAIEREYQRYTEAARTLWNETLSGLFAALVTNHAETFDLLERLVPGVIAQTPVDVELHSQAIRLNYARLKIRAAIDAACRAPYTDVKSYHD